jgi:hypothetical protein
MQLLTYQVAKCAAIGCLLAFKRQKNTAHQNGTHNMISSRYWEGMAQRMVANLHTDPHILSNRVAKAMADPRFVSTLGGMKGRFEHGDATHLDKAYFLERAPFIHDVTQLEDELTKLKAKWNDKYPTLGPSPAPDRIEIIGAGMAGLCLAVRLNTVYPSAKIDIHEKRKRDNTCDRFQTLSIRFGREDRLCETVFEGTDFLKEDGLFEDVGGWKEPLRPGQTDTERRVRAPIGVFQDALIKYLSQKEGVQIHYDSNPGLTPRPDGVDYRFIATGLRKQTTLAPNAPFSLQLTSKIRHAWTFKATNALNIQPSGAIKKEGVYSTMNGGNEIKKLGVFFTAILNMIDKGFVKHSKMDDFSRDIQHLIEMSKSEDPDTEKKYCQIDVDSQFYVDGKTPDPEESAWYVFDVTPSIGMDPFYLASDGRTIALGDHVNARHPFLGNGTLGIFKNIDNIMGYIARNQRLKSLPDSTTDLELSRSITTKQHQAENTRQLLMSIRQHLVYLEGIKQKKQ